MAHQDDVELRRLELERERFEADERFRTAELEIRKSELASKKEAAKDSSFAEFFKSPTVVIAVIGVIGTVVGYVTQAHFGRELEQRKFEYEAVKLALQQPTEKDKLDLLVLLTKWKIVTSFGLTEAGLQTLSNSGQLPTVRTPAEAQRLSDTQKSIAVSCVRAAQRIGVNAHYMLALGMMESGLRPNATSAASSAFGLFQTLQSTWASFIDKHGKDEGLSDADKSDASAQCVLGAYLIADYAGALKNSSSKDPTPIELYLAHRLGVGRVVAIMKADPTVSIEIPLGSRQLIQIAPDLFRNADGSSRTVQQVLDSVRARLEKALAATSDLVTQASLEAPAAATGSRGK